MRAITSAFLLVTILTALPSLSVAKPQALSTQDEVGNIAFQFDNVASVKIAQQSATSGGTCPSGSEGAIRYNTTLRGIEFCNGEFWLTLGGSGPQKILSFTEPGIYRYTPSSGTERIIVKVVGAGGGGGNQNNVWSEDAGGAPGGGGGSGGYCEKVINYPLLKTAFITINVGRGGEGTNAFANAVGSTCAAKKGCGGNGESSSFGSLCIAYGGNGGQGGGIPGTGGAAINGDVNFAGTEGQPAYSNQKPGPGANGPWGGGGRETFTGYGLSTIYPATAGTSPGAGGGGAGGKTSSGKGASGIVIVYEY